MLDMLTGILPPRKLLGLIANEIAKQTYKQCDYFEMVYSVVNNDLIFKVPNEDGTITQASYPEGTSIGGLIQSQALSKLPENSKVIYCIVKWHRTDDDKCRFIVYYEENGKSEKLETNF